MCDTFLMRRFSQTTRLLTSVMFRDAFPRRRVSGRIRIVVSRVRDCRSDPSRLVFSSFRRLVFPGRPLKEGVLNGPSLLHDFGDRRTLGFASHFCGTAGVVFFVRNGVSFGGIVHAVRGIATSVPFSVARHRQARPFLCVPGALALGGRARRTRMVVNDQKCGTCGRGQAKLCLLGGLLKKPNVGDQLGISLHRHQKLICGMRTGLASCASAKIFYVCFKASPRSTSHYVKLIRGRLGGLHSDGLDSSRLDTTGGRVVKRVKITKSGFRGGTLSVKGAFLRCNGFRNPRRMFGQVRVLATRRL